MASKLADIIVFDIVDELTDRNGFDHWWFNLDQDIQQELMGALIATVDANLEREASLKTT